MSRQGATSKLNGGEWVQLRAYTMDVGDGWYVRVSNRSSAVGYIITEAVKATKAIKK